MVTETYFVKEEMTNEEIEKQKKEDEKLSYKSLNAY